MEHDREGAGRSGPSALPGGPGALPGWPTQLRGRREELAGIRAALQALTAGRGGIRLVRGLPGAGKTTLLDAAEDMAGPLGIKVARGSGLAATITVPFGVLLIRQMSSCQSLRKPVNRTCLTNYPQVSKTRPTGKITKSNDESGIRTHAPEETRSLVWRLRPLGHLTMYKIDTNTVNFC